MTADTEEIIDLTDLIEEGETSAQASRPSAEKDSLDEQLQSLNDVPHASGDAIDSLLQQMGQGAPETVEELRSPSLSGPDAPSQGPDENPNEKIVMPGIDDVDALLNHLDIPSQPHTTTAAPVEEGAALDSAVEDLLSSAGVKVPPAAAPAAQPEPAPPASAGEGIEDLLRDVGGAAPAAPTAPSPAASAGDEMEALLRDVSGGVPASSGRPSPDDDIEAALDADLTSLMADMGDPVLPSASPAADAVEMPSERKSAEEALDDLLASDTDLPLAPQAAPKAPAAQPVPAKAAAPSAQAKAAPKAAAKSPVPATTQPQTA